MMATIAVTSFSWVDIFSFVILIDSITWKNTIIAGIYVLRIAARESLG